MTHASPRSFRSLVVSGPHVLRRLLVAWAAVTLSGCFGPGGIETAYDNADWLLGKEVERRLCPRGERRAAWETAIDRVHRWHRKHELPRYAAVLRTMADGLADGVSRAEFDAVVRALDAASKRLFQKVAGPAATLLARRSPEEVECLVAANAASQATAEAAAKEPDLPRTTVTTTLERLEPFTGAFSDAQRAAVLAAWAPTAADALADAARRARGAAAFLALLGLDGEAARRDALTALFLGRRPLVPEDDAESVRQRKRTRDRIWQLLNLLTDDQRGALARSARTVADTLDRLAKRG